MMGQTVLKPVSLRSFARPLSLATLCTMVLPTQRVTIPPEHKKSAVETTAEHLIAAAVMHPNRKAYFFIGSQYYRFDFQGDAVDKAGTIGVDGWMGVPTDIGAAVLHPNGKAYLFAGDQYYRFDFERDVVDKVGIIGIDGWKGLPTDIDAAVMHPNGKAYFFKGIRYYRFDFQRDSVDMIGTTADGWRGLPPEIGAAVLHPNGEAYFFAGNQYYRFDFQRGALQKVGTIGVDGWSGLPRPGFEIPGRGALTPRLAPLTTIGAVCGWGAPDCNKCVNGVESAFGQANVSSAAHMHGRLGPNTTHYRTNQLNHNQGIGRLYNPDGRFVVLSRSMEGRGQLLMFHLRGYPQGEGRFGSTYSHATSNVVVWQFDDEYDRNHPDGLSVTGHYFIHGISCEGGGKCERERNMPRVYVWNAANPRRPVRTLNLDLVNWLGDVPNNTASAGAATLVKLSTGDYLIIVKSKQVVGAATRRVVRFLRGSSLSNATTWSQVTVLPESEIASWDSDDFNYQHLSAVTDCSSGTVYVIATKGYTNDLPILGGCDDNSEVARLYRLGVSGSRYVLAKRGHRYFSCADGVAFGGAGGVYMSRDGRLNFYTAEKTYHTAGSGVKVKFREFYSGSP
jgi:hypothetical protein